MSTGSLRQRSSIGWEPQQQQFARSASARLPRGSSRHNPAAFIDYDDDEDEDDDDDDYAEKSSGQDSRDGERKIQQVSDEWGERGFREARRHVGRYVCGKEFRRVLGEKCI